MEWVSHCRQWISASVGFSECRVQSRILRHDPVSNCLSNLPLCLNGTSVCGLKRITYINVLLSRNGLLFLQNEYSELVVCVLCRFGSLQSIRVLPDKYCAFVNFQSKECAGRAMQGLQVRRHHLVTVRNWQFHHCTVFLIECDKSDKFVNMSRQYMTWSCQIYQVY